MGRFKSPRHAQQFHPPTTRSMFYSDLADTNRPPDRPAMPDQMLSLSGTILRVNLLPVKIVENPIPVVTVIVFEVLQPCHTISLDTAVHT